jgi:hypothetical protein
VSFGVFLQWGFFTISPSVFTVASCMGTNPETGTACKSVLNKKIIGSTFLNVFLFSFICCNVWNYVCMFSKLSMPTQVGKDNLIGA